MMNLTRLIAWLLRVKAYMEAQEDIKDTKMPTKKPKKVTSSKTRVWWEKHKQKVYIFTAIVGSAGLFNADRLDILPVIEFCINLPERLDKLEERVKILETNKTN